MRERSARFLYPDVSDRVARSRRALIAAIGSSPWDRPVRRRPTVEALVSSDPLIAESRARALACRMPHLSANDVDLAVQDASLVRGGLELLSEDVSFLCQKAVQEGLQFCVSKVPGIRKRVHEKHADTAGPARPPTGASEFDGTPSAFGGAGGAQMPPDRLSGLVLGRSAIQGQTNSANSMQPLRLSLGPVRATAACQALGSSPARRRERLAETDHDCRIAWRFGRFVDHRGSLLRAFRKGRVPRLVEMPRLLRSRAEQHAQRLQPRSASAPSLERQQRHRHSPPSVDGHRRW